VIPESETERRKAASARLYLEVFGRGNLAAADEILAPALVSHAVSLPPRTGTDGIKAQAVLLRTAIPDLRVSLEDQIAEGDRVVSRWFGSGTHSGPLALPGLAPVDPTGAPIGFAEIRIDRFNGDWIVESWFIPDRFGLWQQLGLIPSG
jgi:predicted ester cyclase